MINKSYWEKRYETLELENHKKNIETLENIKKGLLKAREEIDKDIESWFIRFRDNNEGLDLVEAKRLLKSKELKEFKWKVEDYIKHGKGKLTTKTMKMLENASARFHISRLESLKVDIITALDRLGIKETNEVENHLGSLYKDNYYKSLYTMSKGMGVGFSVASMDKEQIEKILQKPWASDGKLFSERIWKSNSDVINTLERELTRTITRGISVYDSIEELRKVTNKEFNTKNYQIARLLRTESAYICQKAHADSYKELGVEEFEIVATLDKHTSEICQKMDGVHLPLSEFKPGITAPPFHPFCRSCTVPYFDDDIEKDIAERVARDENGDNYDIKDMTFREWEKTFILPSNFSDEQFFGGNNNLLYKECVIKKIRYKEPKKLNRELTEDELIDKLGKKDNTVGSCSSVAFAYIGNKAGYDVIDFRGGESCGVFSNPYNILKKIGNYKGVKKWYNISERDIKDSNDLFNKVVQGKEYYFGTGKHAAIIRKNNVGNIEYLELQDFKNYNGFKRLDDFELIRRFKCYEPKKKERENRLTILIDAESLAKSQDFIDMLGYINNY